MDHNFLRHFSFLFLLLGIRKSWSSWLLISDSLASFFVCFWYCMITFIWSDHILREHSLNLVYFISPVLIVFLDHAYFSYATWIVIISVPLAWFYVQSKNPMHLCSMVHLQSILDLKLALSKTLLHNEIQDTPMIQLLAVYLIECDILVLPWSLQKFYSFCYLRAAFNFLWIASLV